MKNPNLKKSKQKRNKKERGFLEEVSEQLDSAKEFLVSKIVDNLKGYGEVGTKLISFSKDQIKQNFNKLQRKSCYEDTFKSYEDFMRISRGTRRLKRVSKDSAEVIDFEKNKLLAEFSRDFYCYVYLMEISKKAFDQLNYENNNVIGTIDGSPVIVDERYPAITKLANCIPEVLERMNLTIENVYNLEKILKQELAKNGLDTDLNEKNFLNKIKEYFKSSKKRSVSLKSDETTAGNPESKKTEHQILCERIRSEASTRKKTDKDPLNVPNNKKNKEGR